MEANDDLWTVGSYPMSQTNSGYTLLVLGGERYLGAATALVASQPLSDC